MTRNRRFGAVALVCSVLLVSQDALASSWGVVTGKLQFYQKQGNYCPWWRNCTGARYPESQYQTNMPVADAKVYAFRQSDNVLIGQGTTDSSGNYSLSWYDPSGAGLGSTVYIAWQGEHKDGRFAIKAPSGANWRFYGPVVTLGHGVYTSAGTVTWGNAGLPNPLANLYDGARRGWSASLAQSNRMRAYFSGVDIVSFGSAVCSTSCADGWNNTIHMDDQSQFQLSVILHEMGHIASFRSSRDQAVSLVSNYCYPSSIPSTACGWQHDSDEWASDAFEEAVASFFGEVALHAPSAPQAFQCRSAGVCSGLDLEVAYFCDFFSPRRDEISQLRYFWDVYDTNSDFTGETFQRGVWEIADTLHAFDNGVNNRQKDEGFDSTWSVDDLDGRSLRDFVEIWKVWGTDSNALYNSNCRSAGD